MADVQVSQGATLALTVTPGVCAVTGVPTPDRIRLKGQATAAWVGWLLLFGAFTWLFASVASGRRFGLTVSLDRSVSRRYRRWRRWAVVLVIGGLALMVGVGTVSGTGALVCALLPAAGILLGVVNLARHTVGVTLADDGAVVLTRVHPRFRDAVRDAAPATSGVSGSGHQAGERREAQP